MKKKPQIEAETSKSIEEQTKAFLKSGGAIEKVKSGVSGQQSVGGTKHIKLGGNTTQ